MVKDRSWGQDFAQLRHQLDLAVDTSRHAAEWARAQLGRVDLPLEFEVLAEQITCAQSIANELSDRLHDRPLSLLINGRPLPREAYYLLVALGVLEGGTYTGDSYSDFQMLHHEDDERQCYICLDERPPSATIRIHFGRYPEEIAWESLRPEQRDFFDSHLPEVAARFAREP